MTFIFGYCIQSGMDKEMGRGGGKRVDRPPAPNLSKLAVQSNIMRISILFGFIFYMSIDSFLGGPFSPFLRVSGFNLYKLNHKLQQMHDKS